MTITVVYSYVSTSSPGIEMSSHNNFILNSASSLDIVTQKCKDIDCCAMQHVQECPMVHNLKVGA